MNGAGKFRSLFLTTPASLSLFVINDTTMKKYFHWLVESNRLWHVFIVLLVGLILGIEGAIAASATAEFKDWLWNGHKGGIFGWVKGNGFDWLDFAASMIGGGVGSLLRYFLFS